MAIRTPSADLRLEVEFRHSGQSVLRAPGPTPTYYFFQQGHDDDPIAWPFVATLPDTDKAPAAAAGCSRPPSARLWRLYPQRPVPSLNGFRRLGSRQSRKRLSRSRHWLQPTTTPFRYSRVTGSFGYEGAAITAGKKNGDRQHDDEDHLERLRQRDDVHGPSAFQRSRVREGLDVVPSIGSSAFGHAAFERHYRIGELAETWQLAKRRKRNKKLAEREGFGLSGIL